MAGLRGKKLKRMFVCMSVAGLLVLTAVSSVAYACKVSSVNLFVSNVSSDDAETNEGDSTIIPVGDTAYFYATCTVSEDPDPNDIKWKFDLDGDGTYEFDTTTAHDVLYADPNETYSDPNLYNIKACACIDNGDATMAKGGQSGSALLNDPTSGF